ncbi:D-alanyl-D-alanine carboxypeptidase-like protein [Natranaerovirga pectinivora]|uniref:D-alanyl-D-alanine carboxypeptidase-like protein n=1 Tax=Natranaerovirga pectinivora TaxID=682400 RepID=A0A4V2V0A6_9FIRM|nr:D-alanyl-D-alanine carboxypeptidase [Natranaerovirga pectinivora]TCT14961.1 D-alanyl-D-alanine carboxypeptidase-like protein [Natranaerovirga pectinivora]
MKRIFIVFIFLILVTSGCRRGNTIVQSFPYPILDTVDTKIDLSDFEQLKPVSQDIFTVSSNFKNSVSININTTASLLIDSYEQNLLYANNIFEKIYPASITKIMTALVLLDYGNLDEEVVITHNFNDLVFNAKRSGISKGDILTLEQLLHSILIDSGNDSAIAIAKHIAGSVEDFAVLMNEKAKELGALDSNFVNPHGLYDENQYSTAYDLYLLFNEGLKNEKFKEIIGLPYYNATYHTIDGKEVKKTWMNTNMYLHSIHQVNNQTIIWGGKTGFITASGYNLVLLSYINNTPYISLIIGSQTRELLYEDMSKILNSIELIKLR